MGDALQRRFISASLRFRRADVYYPASQAIHIGEYIVLDSIMENPDCPVDVTAVQQRLHISRPGVSQILNSLEKKGCINRSTNSGDRRKINVMPTSKGCDLLRESREYYNQLFGELCNQFGEQGLQHFVEQLDLMAEIYEQIQKRME